MSVRSSVLRRVLVAGAVVALSTVFIAPLAGSSENDSSLDPVGVDVPGLQAAKVSGEAVGCHSEIELNINFNSPFFESLSVGTAADLAAQTNAEIAKIPTGDVGALGQVLQGVQSQVTQQVGLKAADEEGEDALFHQEAGPVPTVKLPWQGGGPVTESEGDCTLDLFGFIHIPLATDLKVETEGAIGVAGYSHTEADSSDDLGLLYEADSADSECLATLADIEAKTDISDGRYIDLDSLTVKDIPEHPKKNDELTGFEFNDTAGPFGLHFEVSLNANEQDEETNAVTVTALTEELQLKITYLGQPLLDFTIDGLRSQSHCDIDPQAVPAAITVEPKFTG
jgi:hypothetical protein